MKNYMGKPSLEAVEMHEALSARYTNFDAVLAFVNKAKLPTCKCSIRAATVDGHDAVSWGYSNSAEHVAAAICLAQEEIASEEAPDELGNLTVRREGPTAFVHSDDYCFIWFSRLTSAEVEEAKQGWISRTILLDKDKSAANQVRLRAALSKRDPFEETLIHPYLPGGEWDPPEA